MFKRPRPHTLILGLAVLPALGLIPTAAANTGTVLLVVVNSASLTAQESARQTLMSGWGYTVVPISASASQATFDAGVLTSSMAYVCCTITGSTLSTKLVSSRFPS